MMSADLCQLHEKRGKKQFYFRLSRWPGVEEMTLSMF